MLNKLNIFGYFIDERFEIELHLTYSKPVSMKIIVSQTLGVYIYIYTCIYIWHNFKISFG